MVPIVASIVCMREHDGGVNGAVVITKLHKIKLLFSLVIHSITSCCHVGLPRVPRRQCRCCTTLAAEEAPPIPPSPPFPPHICLPKGPVNVNVQRDQSNCIVIVTYTILLVEIIIILFAIRCWSCPSSPLLPPPPPPPPPSTTTTATATATATANYATSALKCPLPSLLTVDNSTHLMY
jgi:hypothetical protein